MQRAGPNPCPKRRRDSTPGKEHASPAGRYSGDSLLTIAATDEHLPRDAADIAWLYLPMEECQIERALMRAGIQADEMRLCVEENELPEAMSALVEINDVYYALLGLSQAPGLPGVMTLCARRDYKNKHLIQI